jgi:hypothetical protein
MAAPPQYNQWPSSPGLPPQADAVQDEVFVAPDSVSCPCMSSDGSLVAFLISYASFSELSMDGIQRA